MPHVTLVRKQHSQYLVQRVALVAGAVVVVVVTVVIVVVVVGALKHNSIAKQEQQLDAQGNFSAETALLTGYMDSKPPKRYQYAFAVRLGDLTYKAQQYSVAAGWYFRAYTLHPKPDLHVITQLADVSARLGDKTNAISYYRKAIAMTPAKDYEQAGEYQDQLHRLEVTP